MRALQSALAILGYRDSRDVPLQGDGVFGPRTGEAVRAFQQAQGLQVDGIVGPDTRMALDQATTRQGRAASPALDAGTQEASPLDALLTAARTGDPAELRTALTDLANTPGGRAFYDTVRQPQPDDAARSAQAAALQPGCQR